jgi:hypothetical protein
VAHAVQKLRGLGEWMLRFFLAHLVFKLQEAQEWTGTVSRMSALTGHALVDSANDRRRGDSTAVWI